MQGDARELHGLLQNYRTALLTTRGPDGFFHSRPMVVRYVEGDETLWFATALDTQKVADLVAEPRCAVAFHDGHGSSTYVSMSGDIEVIRDPEKRRELWSPSWRAWFPEGPDRDDVVLLGFHPEHAEYVHPTTGRLKVLATRVKSMLGRGATEPGPKKELGLPH